MIKSENEDINYVAECAEAVGFEVNDETAFSFNFIAKVMRKMREQSIVIPEGATFGDMIETVFPGAEKAGVAGEFYRILLEGKPMDDFSLRVSEELWNSLYRKE